jgi:hypothetical protein
VGSRTKLKKKTGKNNEQRVEEIFVTKFLLIFNPEGLLFPISTLQFFFFVVLAGGILHPTHRILIFN